MLQCVAVRCSEWPDTLAGCSVLQHVAVRCSARQNTLMCCSVLQGVAVAAHVGVLCCSTLQ